MTMNFWSSDSVICSRCGGPGPVRFISGKGYCEALCIDGHLKGRIPSLDSDFDLAEIDAAYLSLPKENLMTKKSTSAPAVLNDPIAALRLSVERLVPRVGTLAFPESEADVRRGLETSGAAAFSQICPSGLKPVDAATLRDFQIALEGSPAHFEGSMVSFFVALHETSIDSHPCLAECVRSSRARQIISRRVTGSGGDERAIAIAIGKYSRAISLQLQRRELFRPAVDILLEVPTLLARVDELAKQHADYVAGEDLERKRKAEQADTARKAALEAAETKADEARLRAESPELLAIRENLARNFEKNQGFVFSVDGQMLSAVECARRLRRGALIEKFYKVQGSGVWYKVREAV